MYEMIDWNKADSDDMRNIEGDEKTSWNLDASVRQVGINHHTEDQWCTALELPATMGGNVLLLRRDCQQ